MTVFIKREYDYAIRICAYLASLYPNEHISVPEISAKLDLTVPFTTKIVYQLKKGKILETIQGKFGGIKLMVDPIELSFFQVIRVMGFKLTMNECLRNPKICPFSGNCKIHKFFGEQEKSMIRNLKSAKIADFMITDD